MNILKCFHTMPVFSNGKGHLLDERRLAQTQASSERSFPLGVCLHGPDREGAGRGGKGKGAIYEE